MEVKVTNGNDDNRPKLEVEEIKKRILADEELITIAELPLYYKMTGDIDYDKLTYLFYSSMVDDLKIKPTLKDKLKIQLEAELSEHYLYKLVKTYTLMERVTAVALLTGVIYALYEISLIKNKQIKTFKLKQLRAYIEHIDLPKIIDDILFTIGNTGYMMSLNAKAYTDDLKTTLNNIVFMEHLTIKITDFLNYLLQADDTSTAKYIALNKTEYKDIFLVNKYTEYNLLTQDGKENYIKRHDSVEQKAKELEERIREARILTKDGVDIREHAEIIKYKDFINLIAYDDAEKEILTKDEELPTLKPIKSDYGLINIDRLTYKLPEVPNESPKIISKTAGKGIATEDEAQVFIKIKDDYLKNAKLIFEKPITIFDISVLEALQQILNDGNIKFSVQMVKEKLIHKTDTRRRDDELTADIINSLEKMRKTDLTLDISQELNKTFKKELAGEELSELSRTGVILPIEKERAIIGGTLTEVYIFIKKPNYFTYTEARGQQITYKASEYMLKSGVTSKDDVVIARELIKRIEDLKSIPEQIKLGNGKRWKKNKDGLTKYILYPNLRKIVIDNFLEDTGVLPKVYIKKTYITDDALTDEENKIKKEEHDKNEEIAEKKYYANYRVRKARIVDRIKLFLQTFTDNKAIKDYEIYNNKNEIVKKDKTGTYVRAIGIIL